MQTRVAGFLRHGCGIAELDRRTEAWQDHRKIAQHSRHMSRCMLTTCQTAVGFLLLNTQGPATITLQELHCQEATRPKRAQWTPSTPTSRHTQSQKQRRHASLDYGASSCFSMEFHSHGARGRRSCEVQSAKLNPTSRRKPPASHRRRLLDKSSHELPRRTAR